MEVSEQSWELHFSGNPATDGFPSPNRFRECHADCIYAAFAAPSRPAPTAWLLMGAPGSGKSSWVKAMAIPDLTLGINPDAYKERLPEYDAGRGSSRVHEESSWIARQVRLVAIARSCDLLNDAVGSDAAKYRDLIGRLRESHYTIHLLCVHVLDVEVLLDRVARRSFRTGRTVPEAIIREAHTKVPVAFEVLRHAVDVAEMIDGHDNSLVYAEASGSVGERVPEFLGKLGEVGRKLLA